MSNVFWVFIVLHNLKAFRSSDLCINTVIGKNQKISPQKRGFPANGRQLVVCRTLQMLIGLSQQYGSLAYELTIDNLQLTIMESPTGMIENGRQVSAAARQIGV